MKQIAGKSETLLPLGIALWVGLATTTALFAYLKPPPDAAVKITVAKDLA
jgi:hypothetical protein